MANRKVTAAASQYSPMITAPMAAIETNKSMPITRAIRARTAFITIGTPATAAAAVISRSAGHWASPSLAVAADAKIKIPEITGTAQRRCSH